MANPIHKAHHKKASNLNLIPSKNRSPLVVSVSKYV